MVKPGCTLLVNKIPCSVAYPVMLNIPLKPQDCNSVDVNEAYGLFSDKLLNIYDHCIPLTTSIVKNAAKPWLMRGILVAIKKKHLLYRDSLQKKTQCATDKYINYKNKLTKLIRTAHKHYYADWFEDIRGDMS